MEHRETADSSPAPELVSVARSVAFLQSELAQVDPNAPAAELYQAFVDALTTVYRLHEPG